jgi:hypothetical protein
MTTTEKSPTTEVTAVKTTPAKTPAAKPAAKTPAAKPAPTKAAVVEPSTPTPLDPGSVIAAAALGSPDTSNVAPTKDEEVVSASVDLPINIDYEETDRNPHKVLFVLKAYSPACMECSHLQVDPDLPDSGPQKCHFSNGNEHCPARACRVEFVGEKVLFVSRFKKAKASNDSNRILRMMAELSKKSVAVRDEIMKELGLLG